MSRFLRWTKFSSAALVAVVFALVTSSLAADEPVPGSGLYVKVSLAKAVRMSKLKAADVIDGTLARDVYSADHKLFTAGSHVQMTVDHMKKRKRAADDHWPWVVKAFTPRHQNFPVFKSAVIAGDGGETPLQVSLISMSRMRDVHAKAKKGTSAHTEDAHGAVEVSHSNLKRLETPTMIFEAFGAEVATSGEKSESEEADLESSDRKVVPAGTQCKILLLGNVSASKSNPGDVVQARLLEPVLLNGRVAIPAGSLFEGKVVKKTPPRWLSRAGSLYLTFTMVTLPEGVRVPIAASLAGAELDERSHTRMDSEGRLRGDRPGMAWMAINLGVTAGLSKEVDDGVQLIIEAIVSTATDASTAGTARIVSSCISGIYMATRHGRDVILPRFTEMNISLDRPLSLNTASVASARFVAGGK